MKPNRENMENESSDSELINAYLSGDAAAFETLYGRYRQLLYSYLNHLLASENANVDDVFQKTWIKAIDNLEKYRNREKFSAWLMRIAHNTAIDFFRQSKRRAETAFDDAAEDVIPAADSSAPYYEMESSELGKLVESALEALTPEQKEVFLMRQENISFRDIAEIQNCSLNTCLARMQYAVKNLRKIIGGMLK